MLLQRGTTDERRRLALQIAVQLPDRVTDALGVLDETRELVIGFLIRSPRLIVPADNDEARAPPPIAPPRIGPRLRLALELASVAVAFLIGLVLDPPPAVSRAASAIAETLALTPL
jgi:hypothetical protein